MYQEFHGREQVYKEDVSDAEKYVQKALVEQKTGIKGTSINPFLQYLCSYSIKICIIRKNNEKVHK